MPNTQPKTQQSSSIGRMGVATPQCTQHMRHAHATPVPVLSKTEPVHQLRSVHPGPAAPRQCNTFVTPALCTLTLLLRGSALLL